MSSVGAQLHLYFATNQPAPQAIIEALQSVEVSHTDQGPSGFQMAFVLGRGTASEYSDYRLLSEERLKPFGRVIIAVNFGGQLEVLMDGLITNHQFGPSNEPGASTLTLTGEDVSLAMDLEQKSGPRPQQDDAQIVKGIIEHSDYTEYGFKADVKEPTRNETPSEGQRTPNQSIVTDRAYIQDLAKKNGFVFYVSPNPHEPGKNRAYWGPPERDTTPQKALSVNLGPFTNVESISFQFNALTPNEVSYISDKRETNLTRMNDNRSPLAERLAVDLANSNRPRKHRRVYFDNTGRLSETDLKSQAQALVDQSLEAAVTASGELDAIRYRSLLRPRGVVEVRGVGHTYDGKYYVKSVTHRIRRGEYKQGFSLAREGFGALSKTLSREGMQ